MIILKDGERFRGEPNLDPAKIEQLVRDGVWLEDDLAKHGLVAAEPFVAPEGKVAVGEARYVEDVGVVREEYDVEGKPPPSPEPTPAERLAAIGLTPADLVAMIDAERKTDATVR